MSIPSDIQNPVGPI